MGYLRVWNPVITNCISHQRLTDFAKGVGLTCLRSVLIPSLITEGRSHAEGTLFYSRNRVASQAVNFPHTNKGVGVSNHYETPLLAATPAARTAKSSMYHRQTARIAHRQTTRGRTHPLPVLASPSRSASI